MQTMQFSIDKKIFSCPLTLDDHFRVQSMPRSYVVTWSEDHPVIKIQQLMAENPRNLLLMDKNVFEQYGVQLAIDPQRILIVEATENVKTLSGAQIVLDFLQRQQFTKSETLIVVGGGVIQDIGGYASACYKRGIRWIFLPTTLLAMSDSCLGGKVSLNYGAVKNQVGLFYPPHEIMLQPQFLQTLPNEAIRSGLGEILKSAILGGAESLALYRRCVQHGRVENVVDFKALILNALSIKRAVIETDEFETNYRRSLNYGHTLGHAIEGLSHYAVPHGLAVVLGMMMVNELSVQQGLLLDAEKNSLHALCRDLLDEHVLQRMKSVAWDSLLAQLQHDKKAANNAVHFVMLKTVGDVQFVKLPLESGLFARLTGCQPTLAMTMC